MPSLKAIKKRISSVKSTRQITKAMKMVSAAKLRRAQESVIAARPMAQKLEEVINRLASRSDMEGSPLMEVREPRKGVLIVISTDRGLCGGFNANLCKAAERFVKEKVREIPEFSVVAIGRKANEFLRHKVKVSKNYEQLLSHLSFQTAALLAQEIIQSFRDEEYDEVHLIYNSFRSVISQEIKLQRLLPIEPPPVKENETLFQYIYEPSQDQLLEEMLPHHIEIQIFRAMLESVAAEHAARMTAMDSASKNASEMIDKLTLQYNRARQAAITKELMEIISGAESIKG